MKHRPAPGTRIKKEPPLCHVAEETRLVACFDLAESVEFVRLFAYPIVACLTNHRTIVEAFETDKSSSSAVLTFPFSRKLSVQETHLEAREWSSQNRLQWRKGMRSKIFVGNGKVGQALEREVRAFTVNATAVTAPAEHIDFCMRACTILLNEVRFVTK